MCCVYVLCSALYLANNVLCVLQFRLAAEVHLRITIPTLFKHQQHLLQQVLPASTRFVPALQTYVVLDTTSLRWLWQLNKPAHLQPQMMPMIVGFLLLWNELNTLVNPFRFCCGRLCYRSILYFFTWRCWFANHLWIQHWSAHDSWLCRNGMSNYQRIHWRYYNDYTSMGYLCDSSKFLLCIESFNSIFFSVDKYIVHLWTRGYCRTTWVLTVPYCHHRTYEKVRNIN